MGLSSSRRARQRAPPSGPIAPGGSPWRAHTRPLAQSRARWEARRGRLVTRASSKTQPVTWSLCALAITILPQAALSRATRTRRMPGVPATLHRYAYVGNDPINRTDPSGLTWWDDDNAQKADCGPGGIMGRLWESLKRGSLGADTIRWGISEINSNPMWTAPMSPEQSWYIAKLMISAGVSMLPGIGDAYDLRHLCGRV